MEVLQKSDNNRMVLLLIAGIPVTVILVATWLWYYVAHGELDLVSVLGTSNHGSLLQPPRQLQTLELTENGGLPFQYSKLDSKWTLLIPGGDICSATCEKTLYTTRQIHIAMGRESSRIRRLYVSDTPVVDTVLRLDRLSDNHPTPAEFAQYLELEQRGLRAVTVRLQPFQSLFPEYRTRPGTWYLVDPAGWLMMSYDDEVDYKGVMSDLKFLMKNSSE